MSRTNGLLPIIQLANVDKVYSNGATVPALKNISLEITTGEVVAIQGPSGSGKSTLLNLIGTLDQPTSGRVVVDSVDVGTLRGDALADFRRQKIGFVFQLFNLVPTLNALKNVMLPLIPYRRGLDFNLQARAQELLASMGMGDRLDHLPGQLSGGEQQRVALARALINRPRLILADEPTGNLDSKRGQEILSLLYRLNQEQGITLVLVTHDTAVAAQAGRLVQLQDGVVIRESDF